MNENQITTNRYKIDLPEGYTVNKKAPSNNITDFLNSLTDEELNSIGSYAREELGNRPYKGFKKGDKILISATIAETPNSQNVFLYDDEFVVKFDISNGQNEAIRINYEHLIKLTTKVGKLL